ncbi:hypothetical protein ACTXT7_015902 [Hymenolepis weldensis]
MTVLQLSKAYFTTVDVGFSSLKLLWKNHPPQKGFAYVPTTVEKVANFVTHLPWIPISISLTTRLIEKTRNPFEIVVACVYGSSMCEKIKAKAV